MSHENMYVAEKELCKGTLIELERLNDVKGIGRQRRKERRQQAPPQSQETVLEFRNGVMARVMVAPSSSGQTTKRNSGHDPMQPFVADGGELLVGLSEEQRNAVLLGDPTAVTANDFSRPLIEAPAAEPAPQASLRAPAPSWARRRSGKGAGREKQKAQLVAAAEAETDDEADVSSLAPPQQQQQQPRAGGKRKRKAGEERSMLSFTMGEDDEPD